MLHIKDWKMSQIAAENNGGFCEEIIGVERETEKAMLIVMEWGYTSNLSKTVKVWCPKSAILSDEEYDEELKAENARFEEGCKKYEALLAFAKENGVKVRTGMRKATILEKIKEAGLTYEA